MVVVKNEYMIEKCCFTAVCSSSSSSMMLITLMMVQTEEAQEKAERERDRIDNLRWSRGEKTTLNIVNAFLSYFFLFLFPPFLTILKRAYYSGAFVYCLYVGRCVQCFKYLVLWLSVVLVVVLQKNIASYIAYVPYNNIELVFMLPAWVSKFKTENDKLKVKINIIFGFYEFRIMNATDNYHKLSTFL